MRFLIRRCTRFGFPPSFLGIARQVSAFVSLSLALSLFGSAAVHAAEVTWFGPSGNWSNVNNWFPFQLPAAGDLVWVKAPGGISLSVTYSSPTGPVLGTLMIDSLSYGKGTLIQTQDLLQANEENVGYTGSGVHSISGGSNVFGKLNLGYWGSASGTYDLSGTGSLQAGQEIIGSGGSGRFEHTAGNNAVSGDLNVGFLGGAHGVYNLSGTGTLSSNRLFVGSGGSGLFYQVGTVNSVVGDIMLGMLGGSNGRYELSAGGSLSSGAQVLGGGGYGTLVQTSGSNYASGNLVLGFLGGSSGRYELSGPGTFSAYDQFVGGTGFGRFIQSGGVNTVRRNLTIGQLGGANGAYDLSGDAELTAVNEYLGGFGVGVVTQSGGSHVVSGLLQAGTWGNAYGRYELSGTGVLDVGEMVLGGFGQGHFVQAGGVATIASKLTLCVWPNSNGSYSLSGGSLSVGSIDNRPGCLFDFSGGELDALTFANAAEFDLGGAGVRLVAPAVTNVGAVYVTDTEASFAETFINNGAYTSDHAENDFVDLVVGSGGYLSAGADSHFFILGNLNSSSTRSSLWETSLAEAAFVSSATGAHSLHQLGQDLGAATDGYLQNFAWGKLSLESGQTLSLGGGPGALYVRVLALADGVDQIASLSSDGTNLYYDAAEPENGYLGGASYALTGGGSLEPVPEPSLLLLLAAGIPGLAALARLHGPSV